MKSWGFGKLFLAFIILSSIFVIIVLSIIIFSYAISVRTELPPMPTPQAFIIDEQNRASSIATNNTTVQNLLKDKNYKIINVYNNTKLNVTYNTSTHWYYSDHIIGNTIGAVEIQIGESGFPPEILDPHSTDWYRGECDSYHIPDNLIVTVDMNQSSVISISPGNMEWKFNNYTIVIDPGNYWYKSIYAHNIESPDYGLISHNNTFEANIHYTNVPVRPMVLDQDNFEKFKNGQPYFSYAFDDKLVTRTYENHTRFPPNKEFFYVIKNMDSNEIATVSCTNSVNNRRQSIYPVL